MKVKLKDWVTRVSMDISVNICTAEELKALLWVLEQEVLRVHLRHQGGFIRYTFKRCMRLGAFLLSNK